jgi:hypothetical protein
LSELLAEKIKETLIKQVDKRRILVAAGHAIPGITYGLFAGQFPINKIDDLQSIRKPGKIAKPWIAG